MDTGERRAAEADVFFFSGVSSLTDSIPESMIPLALMMIAYHCCLMMMMTEAERKESVFLLSCCRTTAALGFLIAGCRIFLPAVDRNSFCYLQSRVSLSVQVKW